MLEAGPQIQYNSKLDILYYNMTKSDPINITTTNKTDKNDHIAECKLHLMHNEIFSEASGSDMYAVIDDLMHKVSLVSRRVIGVKLNT